jgi:hypothetical protein
MMADAWDVDIAKESENGDEIAKLDLTDDEVRGLCEKRVQDVMSSVAALQEALGTLNRENLCDELAALNTSLWRIGAY